MNINEVVVFAQSNNSTNSTSSLQSDNKTTGVNNNPHSNLPHKSASDFFDKYNLPTKPPTFRCLDESVC